MSTYNVLLYRQGGTLYLDEPLPDQPSACTVSITQLDGNGLADLGGGFANISDVAATIDNLVLTLPAKASPWRTVAPTATAGTIGYQLLSGLTERVPRHLQLSQGFDEIDRPDAAL